MSDRTLSIFVDESGNFKLPDRESRFYIIGMVIHDQTIDITPEIASLERSDSEIGLEGHCFHAGRAPSGPPTTAARMSAAKMVAPSDRRHNLAPQLDAARRLNALFAQRAIQKS